MTVIQTGSNAPKEVTSFVHPLPLYDALAKKLSEKLSQGNFSVTPNYRVRLRTVLSSLSKDQAEQVALLLIHYHFLNNPESNPFTPENCTSKNRNLPYGIKISPSGKGLSFDLDKLPASFQALLGTYCSL